MSSEHIEKITEVTARDLCEKWFAYKKRDCGLYEFFENVVIPLIGKQKDEAVLDKVDLAHERLDLLQDRMNEVEAVLDGLRILLKSWNRGSDL